jgi:hypothetical protein
MDSNYPQFVDAAENPRAGVFHQLAYVPVALLFALRFAPLSPCMRAARATYYAIRQPARTACGAGVHTLQASSAHRLALSMKAPSAISVSE